MIIAFFTMPTQSDSTGDSAGGFTECLGNGHTKLQPAARRVSVQGRKYSYLFGFIGLLSWTVAEGSTGALEEVTVTATLLTEASPPSARQYWMSNTGSNAAQSTSKT